MIDFLSLVFLHKYIQNMSKKLTLNVNKYTISNHWEKWKKQPDNVRNHNAVLGPEKLF